MAVPSIGSYSFDAWGAIIALGGPTIRLYEQGGIDGYGVVVGGMKTGQQNVPTKVREGSESDANADLAGYRALIGTSVAISDQFGNGWNGVIITNVVCTLAEDPLGWILNATWTVLPQSS